MDIENEQQVDSSTYQRMYNTSNMLNGFALMQQTIMKP